MKKLVGTWKLTEFTQTYRDGRPSEDALARDNITAYLIIDGTEFGYLVYSDEAEGNPCPLMSRQIYIKYEYEEGTKNVSAIDYETEYVRDKPMASSGRYGFLSRDQELNTMTVALFGNDSHTATWKKANAATDLSYVEEALGQKLTPAPYVLLPHHGVYEMNRSDLYSWNYVYGFVKIDAYAQKADMYYASQTDRKPVHESYDITFTTYETNPLAIEVLSFGGKDYSAFANTTPAYIHYSKDLEDGSIESAEYEWYYGGDFEAEIERRLNQSGPMDDLKGTWRLMEYYRYDADGKKTQDLFETDKVKAYLVLDGTENGYLVYKDEAAGNPCSLMTRKVRIQYEYVEGTEVCAITYETEPVQDKVVLGTNRLLFLSQDEQLYRTVTESDSYTNVWIKVDETTDLSYVEGILGETLTPQE